MMICQDLSISTLVLLERTHLNRRLPFPLEFQTFPKPVPFGHRQAGKIQSSKIIHLEVEKNLAGERAGNSEGDRIFCWIPAIFRDFLWNRWNPASQNWQIKKWDKSVNVGNSPCLLIFDYSLMLQSLLQVLFGLWVKWMLKHLPKQGGIWSTTVGGSEIRRSQADMINLPLFTSF